MAASVHRSRWFWCVPIGAIVAALWIASTSPTPKQARAATDKDLRTAHWYLSTKEPVFERKAKTTFPTDAWSQQDDVANQEFLYAEYFARTKRLRLSDVLFAMDRGLREGWQQRPVRATVLPCRPRLDY